MNTGGRSEAGAAGEPEPNGSGGKGAGGSRAQGGRATTQAGEAGAPSDGGAPEAGAPSRGGAAGDGAGGSVALGGTTNSGLGGAEQGGATSSGGVTINGGTTSSSGGTASGGTTVGGTAGAPVGGEAGATAGSSGAGGEGGGDDGIVRLRVRTSVDPRPISPWIYGIDALHGDCADPNGNFGLCRLGGNPYSTYNWENNASNAGSEDCSENNDQLGTSNQPAAPLLELLTEAGTRDAATLLTVPMLKYVAADKLGGSPDPACSGDVRNSTNYLSTRFKQNFAVKNAPLSDPPETSDAAVYQDEFVAFVKARAGDQQVMFSLDNQPELWGRTHAAVHADPPSYAEVTAANIEYARMIRENFADAKILGHGGYGYLAIRTLQDAEPRPNIDFVDFYLDALEAASEEQRLLDYYDVHWYPEIHANGQRIIGEDSSPDSVRARVQATRSLWDPDYIEQTWVSDYNQGAIRLIPWLQDKLDRLYPGTQLAISEWSYGGHNHISGGLAVVDALGIFGRERVGLASLAVTHPEFDFALGGFAIFRNYDGAGAHFGDVSVSAESSDVANVSVYASKESSSGKVVVIALNRSETTTETRLELEDAASYATAKLFRLTQASPLPAAAGSVTFESGGTGLPLSLPAYSATVIVPEQ